MRLPILLILISPLILSYPLSEIDSINFGKSLLDTVSIQLNSGQNIDELLKVLNVMRDTMNSQKEEEEQQHQELQKDCAKDLDYYQQEIASTTVIILDSQRDVDQTKENLISVKKQLEEIYEQMKVYQASVVKLNNLRNEQAKDFKQAMNSHDIAMTVIQEAKRHLVRGDVSFLQMRKNLLAQLSQHFSNAKRQIRNRKYSAFFHVMTQITTRASTDNDEILVKILELCERVLENIAETRNLEQEYENEKINLYNEKKTIFDKNIFNIQTKIDILEQKETVLSTLMATINQVLEDNQHRKEENLKLMNTRKAECDNEIIEYSNLRDKILGQVQIVEQIVTITETNLATMKSYLKERRA